jgi:hypothetical protein
MLILQGLADPHMPDDDGQTALQAANAATPLPPELQHEMRLCSAVVQLRFGTERWSVKDMKALLALAADQLGGSLERDELKAACQHIVADKAPTIAAAAAGLPQAVVEILQNALQGVHHVSEGLIQRATCSMSNSIVCCPIAESVPPYPTQLSKCLCSIVVSYISLNISRQTVRRKLSP